MSLELISLHNAKESKYKVFKGNLFFENMNKYIVK